mgnify:CR=1 FL=1
MKPTTMSHSNMDKSIQIAKSVLANIFKIDVIHFEKHITRSASVNEARRFLIYYLIKECGIKHLHMKYYIPSLINHATSIHHYRKMEQLMEVEWMTKKTYEDFKTKMENEGHTHLMHDYTKAIKEMQMIHTRLATLKKLI